MHTVSLQLHQPKWFGEKTKEVRIFAMVCWKLYREISSFVTKALGLLFLHTLYEWVQVPFSPILPTRRKVLAPILNINENVLFKGDWHFLNSLPHWLSKLVWTSREKGEAEEAVREDFRKCWIFSLYSTGCSGSWFILMAPILVCPSVTIPSLWLMAFTIFVFLGTGYGDFLHPANTSSIQKKDMVAAMASVHLCFLFF